MRLTVFILTDLKAQAKARLAFLGMDKIMEAMVLPSHSPKSNSVILIVYPRTTKTMKDAFTSNPTGYSADIPMDELSFFDEVVDMLSGWVLNPLDFAPTKGNRDALTKPDFGRNG